MREAVNFCTRARSFLEMASVSVRGTRVADGEGVAGLSDGSAQSTSEVSMEPSGPSEKNPRPALPESSP